MMQIYTNIVNEKFINHENCVYKHCLTIEKNYTLVI